MTTNETGRTGPSTLNWPAELALQLQWHWENQLRPRLAGLTDQEYRWEPVPGCWNVRPREPGTTAAAGHGAMVVDYAFPTPEPPPVTTIAWRLSHIVVGVFGDRNARYFGGPPMDYFSYDYPATADQSLADLDAGYDRWIHGVRGLDLADLTGRCREPDFESDSMAAFILHIHREVIHHGAEISLLRDLYRAGR